MTNKNTYNLLSQINIPADLRRLPIDKLPQVCEELRRDIIDELADNPGHFASSLGVVELTVALHYVYDTPYDRIVWDVGHQAYGHKILTGRRERFSTNRKLHGLKPFPSPSESEYDTFTCGHASNSISAALGMAVASANQDEKRRHIIAVIGDGSMSGGLAFEGLNNASSTPNDILIILNDNNMSIDRSVGGMNHYFHQLHTSSLYNRLRFAASRKLFNWGWLNEDRRKQLIRFNNSLKSLISNQQNVFEGMNIRYFGPSDGHDVIELVHTLRVLKDMKGPKLFHIHTVKGKGFKPAEKAADIWHAPGKFDKETGERIQTDTSNLPPRYQDVFGQTLLELARMNPKIIGVTPAMPSGCSMNVLMKEMPDRAFDVGIAEGHAVTFSGGMAQDGLIPFCNIYSSFAQRAYDNLIHDIAIERLNVVLCLDRAGVRVGDIGIGLTKFHQRQPLYFLLWMGVHDASGFRFRNRLYVFGAAIQTSVPFVLYRIVDDPGQEFRAFRICPIVIVLVSLEKFFRIHLKNALLTWNKRPHTNPCGSADVKIVVGFSVLHGKDIQASDNQFLNAVAVQVIQNIRQPF